MTEKRKLNLQQRSVMANMQITYLLMLPAMSAYLGYRCPTCCHTRRITFIYRM